MIAAINPRTGRPAAPLLPGARVLSFAPSPVSSSVARAGRLLDSVSCVEPRRNPTSFSKRSLAGLGC